MKDRVARKLAQEAYDKAVRVYSGVKTGCYDGGCSAYSDALINPLFAKKYQLENLKQENRYLRDDLTKMGGAVADLFARVEALEAKRKKVCKSCGQDRP